jgi:hypothetical protein
MLRRFAVLVAILPGTLGLVSVAGAAAEPKPRAVTVGAVDFAFDAPPNMPGGRVRVTLDNTGAEVHQIDFIKLKEGVDQDAYLAAITANFQGSRDVASYLGGPNSALPGERTSSTQTLSPGDYLIACLLPGPDGVPHVAKGMIQPITIERAGRQVEQKTPKTTRVVLRDYQFDTPARFDGSGPIEIVNRGEELHELVMGRLNDGATPQDVITWGSQPLFVPNPYPQPYRDVGGITAIDPGRRSRINVGQLEPGNYGLFCFVPNAEDESHITLGMLFPFTVRE